MGEATSPQPTQVGVLCIRPLRGRMSGLAEPGYRPLNARAVITCLRLPRQLLPCIQQFADRFGLPGTGIVNSGLITVIRGPLLSADLTQSLTTPA